jgi:hypothetical protein
MTTPCINVLEIENNSSCVNVIEIENNTSDDFCGITLELDFCSKPVLLSDLPDTIITGSGTPNYVTKWGSNSNTLVDSTIYDNGTNVGIGTINPTYKLEVNGAFSATTKSFKIQHPTKCNKTLEYGSLESPYHGIRLTGQGKVVKGKCVIKLPLYIRDLISETNINIQLTNYQHNKILYVHTIDLDNNKFVVKSNSKKKLKFFWTFTGIRKDVPNLIVEK